ncbi:hypothetical protein ASE74_07435 [Pedobacter sp. Leaf216]|uniref:DUF5683 domain-containing protein n=1 Tax=Pedobacter sp. Leaf216 TaxID=1735684 RepID=UPI0006FD285C|nr:DUF5683 domain-containing protein [Pedobacter sp. Leaf216]KQM67288.1 hypothetical protein ASE74_07435 [Pedobacter sp. Leaf216]
MQKTKLLILVSLFTFFLVNLASAQVKDTVLKSVEPTKKIKLSKSIDTAAKKPMTRKDSMKAKYVNPGKVAGRKAVFRSMLIPGWGQLYNIQLLNDGYGTRAGKSQVLQKLYTGGKIVAIYGGATALTLSYLDSRKNYNRFLAEAQYREQNPGKKSDQGLSQYTNQGILDGKSLYKRNSQIVLFSYGLLYAANIVDAYVAARLHFFNIDNNLSFKVTPSMINSSTMYGFNATPALKLSLTF